MPLRSDEDILRDILRERALDRLVALDTAGSEFWAPDAENRPQQLAYESDADEILFGGQAGGGKTDLLVGTPLTKHRRSIVYRKQKVDLGSIKDRCEEILGGRAWSAKDNAFYTPDGRRLELGHANRQQDLDAQQGRARDCVGFDELAQFTLYEYIWLTTWLRTSDPNQRVRILSGSNPPMTQEGMWIIERWAPWLDKNHPHPAKDGELRWYAQINGKDTAVPDGRTFLLGVNGERTYTFDVTQHDPNDIIQPRSRTFIRSRLSDNRYYKNSGYRAILQALPEPMRSAMLNGEFTAAMGTDPFQVIPSAWIAAAMDRWAPKKQKDRGPMDAMGCDCARGGLDKMVLAPRYGDWYDELVSIPGSEVDTGFKALAHIVQHLRDGAPVHVDPIGIGAAVVDAATENDLIVVGVDVRESARNATDRSGTLRFVNKRAELAWAMREALDPELGDGLCLPPDPELRADLAALRFKPTARGIQILSKEEMAVLIGRSPDKGDSVILALPNLAMARVRRIRNGVGRNPEPVGDDDPRGG